MKLIRKGFESIRLSFSQDFEKLNSLIGTKEYKNIFELEKEITKKLEEQFYIETDFDGNIIGGTEKEVKELIKQKKELLKFSENFYNLKNIILNVVDYQNFFIEKFSLHDRDITNIIYKEEKSENKIQIIQINDYKNIQQFGIGSIKFSGMFGRVKEETIFQEVLEEIENEVLDNHFGYLQRVDFYIDFNGTIQNFLDSTKIRFFKTGSIFGGSPYKNDTKKIKINENSTVYRGSTKTKKVVARLYNKRNDAINKDKQKYYSYISEKTKRFEIQIETNEIQNRRKYFYEDERNIKNFLRFLYKNIVLKENFLNGNYYKKFDIDFLRDENHIYENVKTAKIKKYKIKNQSSFKLKHYFGYTKTMIDAFGISEFDAYINKIKKEMGA